MDSTSLTPRRILTGTLVGVLIWSILGGIIGFAVAADERGHPRAVDFGERKIGDAGRYEIQLFEKDEDGVWSPAMDPIIDHDFEWLDPIDVPRRDGRFGAANVLSIVTHETAPDGTPSLWPIQIYSEPGSYRTFAGAWAREQQGEMQDPWPWSEIQTSGTSSLDLNVFWQPYDAPCGPTNGAIGGVHALSAPLVLRACDMRFQSAGDVRWEFLLDYQAHSGAGQDEVFHFANDQVVRPNGQLLEIDLRPGIPYPTRMAIVEHDHGARFSVNDTETVVIERGYKIEITLTAFRHGSDPLPTNVTLSAPFSNVDQVGFDVDAGVHPEQELSFTFQDAFTYAANDPESGLPAFLDSYPDAFPVRTYYHERQIGEREERTWNMRIADGTAFHLVEITQIQEPPGNEAINFLPIVDVPLRLTSYRYEEISDSENRPTSDFTRDMLPETVLDPEGLITRWLMFADDTLVPPVVTWQIMCADSDCEKADLVYSVGGARFERTRDFEALAGDFSQTWFYKRVSFYADGSLATLWDGESSSFRSLDLTKAPPQDPPRAADADEHVVLAASLWTWPSSPVVAGAGILATLAAALYTFWPALKGGLLGLFSRVGRDKLLEHPTRASILRCIEAQPGIHFQELARATGIGRGTVEHHVRKLVETRLVVEQAGTGYHCYFPAGAVDRRVMVGAAALKSRGARDLVAAILSSPGISAGNAAAASGLTAGTVTHHAKRLAELGLVRVERVGRGVKLWPTEQTRAAARLA